MESYFFYKSLNEEPLNFIEFQESLQELTIEKAENNFLGVENTEEEITEDISSPFNPEDINIQQQLLSVKYLHELIQKMQLT